MNKGIRLLLVVVMAGLCAWIVFAHLERDRIRAERWAAERQETLVIIQDMKQLLTENSNRMAEAIMLAEELKRRINAGELVERK